MLINACTILLLLIAPSFSNYTDCGSKPGAFVSLSVTNCDFKKKCVLKKGTDIIIEITFKNVESKTVTSQVAGILGSLLEIPFPLSDNNACHFGIKCPVKTNQINKYKQSTPVLQMYPSVPVDVKWQLIDDAGKPIVCVLIPSRIK